MGIDFSAGYEIDIDGVLYGVDMQAPLKIYEKSSIRVYYLCACMCEYMFCVTVSMCMLCCVTCVATASACSGSHSCSQELWLQLPEMKTHSVSGATQRLRWS